MMKLGFRCSGNGIRGFYFFLPDSQRLPLLYSTSTSSIQEGNPSSSPLVNYLVNSLGLSHQQSLSASTKLAKLRQEGGTKANSFVDDAVSAIYFLKQVGFQQSEIRKIVCYEPRILLSKEETLKAKIKILLDLGISKADLLKIILRNPLILFRRLGPAIHAFKIVLGSDENVVHTLKQSNQIRLSNVANYLIANVELLRNYSGLTSDKIQKRVLQQLRPFILRTELFHNILIRIEEKWGIPRDSGMFLYGIQLLTQCSEKKIEDKCKIFKSFGWTQSDVLALIRRNPLCLTYGEETLKKRLDFLMNHLGHNPTYLASKPTMFTYSVEKRLWPRHRVLHVLKEKGLLVMDIPLSNAASLTELKFLKRFVLPFEEVHEVYAQLTGSTVESITKGPI